MAITNAEIVTMEQLRLLEEGVLHYTGRKLKGINLAGEECEIDEIQPLNTVAAWNKMGYKVIKGEHPIARFSIWKYTHRKPKDADNEEEVKPQGRGYCYMKESNFFTDTQVVKMTPEELERRDKRWNKK